MNGKTNIKFLAFLIGSLLAYSSCLAADHYVSVSGSDSSSGADWNNAWSITGLNTHWSSVAAGSTVWIGGGTYTDGIVLGKSGTAANRIYIKHALSDADSGSAAGWQSSYANQVYFYIPNWVSINGNGYSYITVDGREWTEDSCGIKMYIGDLPNGGGECVRLYNCTNVIIMNCDLSGPMADNNLGTVDGGNSPLYFESCQLCFMSYCRSHGFFNGPTMRKCDSCVFEHSRFTIGVSGKSGVHGNFIKIQRGAYNTFRYNDVSGWDVECIALWGGENDVYVYGNVFHDPFTRVGTYPTHPRVIEPSDDGLGTSGKWYIYFYNNTSVDDEYPVSNNSLILAGSSFKNNIALNNGDSWPDGYSSYNYTDFATGVASDIVNGTTAVFLNYQPRQGQASGGDTIYPDEDNPIANLETSASSSAIGTGIKVPDFVTPAGLAQTFSISINGVNRDADGLWDRGAYEIGSGSSTNPTPALGAATAGYVVGYPGLVETQTVAVANTGSGELTVSNALTGSGTNFVVLLTNCVAPSGGTNIPIRFYHTTPGTMTNELTVYTNGVAAGTVALTAQTMAILGESFLAIDGYLSGDYTYTNAGYIYDTHNRQSDFANASWAYYWFNLVDSGDYMVRTEFRADGDEFNSVWISLGDYNSAPTNGTYQVWDMPTSLGALQTNFVSWRANGTYDSNQFNPMIWSNMVGGTTYLLSVVSREAYSQLHHFELVPFYEEPPPSGTKPYITNQPQDVHLILGMEPQIWVGAGGTETLLYQWYKNGSPISEQTNYVYSWEVSGAGDAGSFFVVVTNDSGSVTSRTAVATYEQVPAILSVSGPQTNAVGDTIVLRVSALGAAPLAYQWRLNGANVANATNDSHTIASATTNDAGSYVVVVTNSFGSITSDVAAVTLVGVAEAPYILTNPVNQTVIVSSNFTFTCSAGGYSPLSYQWRRNGTNLEPGGNWSSYSPWYFAAYSGAAGLYDCVVTNIAGSVTSSAAWLNVLSPESPPLLLRVVIPAGP